MTRKDYVLLASALAATRPPPALAKLSRDESELLEMAMDGWTRTRDKIMHALQGNNPRFNADIFRDATLK